MKVKETNMVELNIRDLDGMDLIEMMKSGYFEKYIPEKAKIESLILRHEFGMYRGDEDKAWIEINWVLYNVNT